MLIVTMLLVSGVVRCPGQMDPENKPTREELKEEVLKVSKGLAGLGGFNLVRTYEGIVRGCWS